MSGVRRLFVSVLLGGLASAVAAQSSPVAPPPPSRADTVGPEQLRNFALPGSQQTQQPDDNRPAATTPTRPAPAATTALPPTSRERATTTTTATTSGGPSRPTTTATRPAETVSVPLPRTQAPPAAADPSSPLLPTAPQPATTVPATPGFSAPEQSAPEPVVPAPVTTSEPSDGNWLTTWLPILALVLAGGGFAWWWPRRRKADPGDGFGQLAFAGAPAGAALEPAPASRPVPAPAPKPQPEAPVRAPSVGLVSSRLRAWLDLELGVRVAAITEDELSIEVDIILTNSGSAAAREIAVEALLINAGPNQGKEVATFFARADADGFAADGVAPMKQMALSATLKMPRGGFQEYAVGGGKVVVPIVALNAGYKAGSARGRTSAAFLVGRAGADADKLGPFPTDQGPKGFNRLGLKRLPEQIRR